MANNRMYLTCACGKSLYLAQSMGGEYHRFAGNSTPSAFAAQFDDFMAEHWLCAAPDPGGLGTVTYFRLTYEHASDPEKEHP